MRAPSSASRRGLTVYFRRDSFLSQLISVLLAWAMIMSSLPVYATDQPHAKWVHSWDLGSGPKATTPSPHKDVSATVARSAVLWARRNISRNAGLPSRLARITRVLEKSRSTHAALSNSGWQSPFPRAHRIHRCTCSARPEKRREAP
jgi:hypothetical protein